MAFLLLYSGVFLGQLLLRLLLLFTFLTLQLGRQSAPLAAVLGQHTPLMHSLTQSTAFPSLMSQQERQNAAKWWRRRRSTNSSGKSPSQSQQQLLAGGKNPLLLGPAFPSSTIVPAFVTFPDYCANDTDVIDHILYDTTVHYNRHKLPSDPVKVRIELWIQEITSVSELTQDFEIDLYVNEFWEDPALSYDYLRPCKENLTFDYNFLDTIWIPNTCFINSKSAQIHRSPVRNVFLMIYPNGSVWSCWRIKSTGPCKIDLHSFPMDTMSCMLTFESYQYNRNHVRMVWRTNPVLMFKDIELPDFSMVNYSLASIRQKYAAGVWDELTVTFYFQRRYGWYLLQGFYPSFLFMFISWIPFYLGPKAIPARTTIGVNTLLAMVFQSGSIVRNLPRVSYIKATDWWTLCGMTFILASMVELAVIGFKMRNEGRATIRLKDIGRRKSRKTDALISCERLDFYSRIAFPAFFSLFNAVYWSYYMFIAKKWNDKRE